MKESILTGKRILVVDDKPDVLAVLRKEILESCPGCRFEAATTYQEAVEKMMSWTYDAVILYGMGTWDFDLLNWAFVRNFPVGMLTIPYLNPEPVSQAVKTATRFYLPKQAPGEIVPFLEDIMWYEHSPWWERFIVARVGSEGVRKLIGVIFGIFSHLPFSKAGKLKVSLCTCLPAARKGDLEGVF